MYDLRSPVTQWLQYRFGGYWGCLGAFLFGFFEMFLIDFFSFLFAFPNIRNWCLFCLDCLKCSELISVLFDFQEIVSTDLLSTWTIRNFLIDFWFWICWNFRKWLLFVFGYWGILGAPFANQTPRLKKANSLSN